MDINPLQTVLKKLESTFDGLSVFATASTATDKVPLSTEGDGLTYAVVSQKSLLWVLSRANAGDSASPTASRSTANPDLLH